MAESQEELKSLLMTVKEESEIGRASCRERVEAVVDFIFLDSKITADGDCSPKTQRHLLLRKKAMTNLDSILKSRDITLLTVVHLVKGVVFPVVMYGCESWSIKKAECRSIDAFELWYWRRHPVVSFAYIS